MQRPSSKKIKEFQIIDQFEKKNIGAVVCLQEPGEHPKCGDGLNKDSGLSYEPMEFYAKGIQFINYGWRDHQVTGIKTMLSIIRSIDAVIQRGKKVAVHCHAGKGRTGMVICSYMMYKY